MFSDGLPSDPQPASSDRLSPDQQRRLELWRAMTMLTKARAAGTLSPEQARILEGLADNLQQLAVQMGELARLGRQYVEQLEEHRRLLGPAGDDRADDAGSSAVA